MAHLKFDISKLERLNDTGRFESLPPRVMWEALGEPSPRVIVEIGAGTGMFAAAFLALAPDATVYAADIEDVMLDWMRDNRPEVATGRLVPLRAEEARVMLPSRVADLVYTVNLHHELVDPRAGYAEAFRLLSPEGQIMVVDWAPRDTPKGPPQEVRASAERIGEMLEAVGFVDVEVHEVLPWHSLVTARREPETESGATSRRAIL